MNAPASGNGARNRPFLILAIALLLLAAGCIGTEPDEAPDEEPETALGEGLEHQSVDARTLLDQLGRNGTEARDSDNDGLPDIVENFVYGSDPHDASTTDSGVPDGWLAEHGYDPTRPGVASEPAAVPSPNQLPDPYQGTWPETYDWTLEDAYRHAIPPDWHTSEDGVWDNGIDPREISYRDEGIPYAWLVHHGIETVDESAEQRTLADDGLTVRQNYEHDTDPRSEDTDGDGLTDAAEIRRHGTDPAAFSTSGTGIADGWLVDHGYDPTDPRVGTQRTTGKGLTVAETWTYNVDRFGLEAALRGEGLEPDRVSTLDTGIPDGWLVEHDLDPLDGSLPDETADRASDHERVRHLTQAPEDRDPLPDLSLTVRDHYVYERPPDWRETSDGVWDGGLDPSNPDPDGDGLATVLEIRGWYAQRALDVGPEPDTEWYHATSDPLTVDTDGDGLPDGEEHDGRALREGTLHVFEPSDPRNADTAFSGLSDGEKVLELDAARELEEDERSSLSDVPSDAERIVQSLLDPTKRDSAGSFLADGEEFAYWTRAAEAVGDRSYADLFPGSQHPDHASWVNDLDAFADVRLSQDVIAEQLGPLGDVDQDGLVNVVDPDSTDDGVLDGWAIDPATLVHADAFPHAEDGSCDRAVGEEAWIDPANPDTDGDGLPDAWELEHGRCTDDGRWDLTPALWDSDGDGTSDADGNLNDDTVTWHTFDGTQRTQRTFAYTNLHEFERGTDPRQSDPDGEGITQGWLFFWTVQYPAMLRQPDAGSELGAHRPLPEEVEGLIKTVSGAHSREPIGDTVKQVGGSDQEIPYRRVVDLGPAGWDQRQDVPVDVLNEAVLPTDDQCEGFPDEPCTVLAEGGGTTEKHLLLLEGTYEHVYAHDQALGLNPYMEDTSGNGIPDAWLALYGWVLDGEVVEHGQRKGCDQVDPLDPTPSEQVDPTGDGLTLWKEYSSSYPPGVEPAPQGAFTSDPCLVDTDHGGLFDAEERSQTPWTPTDDVIEGDGDQDADGLTDRQEVTIVGSNPGRADTAVDGLLDGEGLSADELDEDLSARLLRSGIAHVAQGGEASRFFGAFADTFSEDDPDPLTDPLIPDSTFEGIPDGWVRAYNLRGRAADEAEELHEAYACNRPDWWSEARLGVWWWGADPPSSGGSAQCPSDLDGDGLLDASGEDPIPAADPANDPAQRRQAWQTDDPGTFPGHLHPADTLDDPTLEASQRIQIAQTWGACAGNAACISGWHGNQGPTRAPTSIEVTEAPDRIHKGEAFWVNGTLEACAPGGDGDCQAAPNRTVGVYVPDVSDPIGVTFSDPVDGSFEMPLGLAFTDEEGSFAIEACVCEGERSLMIPEDGMVALARDRVGEVSWAVATEEVTAGPTALNVSAYASVPNSGEDHPHYIEVDGDGEGEPVHATQRNATGLEVTTETDTQLSIATTPATSVQWTPGKRSATVTVELTDATDDPVSNQPVTIQLEGTSLSEQVTTNEDGRASAPMSLPEGTSTVTIRASFDPDPDADLFTGSQASTSLVLQQQNQLEVELSAQDVDIGDILEVDVAVSTPAGDPVPDRTVIASFAGSELETDTDEDGGAHFAFDTTPLDPETLTLTVHVEATESWTRDETSRTVHVVTGTRLEVSPPDVVRRGETTTVTGQLATTDGDPIPGENVTMTLGDRKLANATTGAEGTFQASLAVPEDAEAGLQDLTASFEGTLTHDATSASAPVRVVVPTTLSVGPVRTTPGDTATIEGMLTRNGDHPVAGEHVSLHLEEDRIDRVLTGDDGAFQTTHRVPENATFGILHGNASYDGSRNGTYGATSSPLELIVRMPTMLEAQTPSEITRGEHTWAGRLEAQDGSPVADAPVHVSVPDGPERTERTDDDGRFQTRYTIGEDPTPGPVTLQAAFAGNQTLHSATARAEPVLTVTPQLRVHVLGDAGRGTDLEVEAAVLDDVARPVPEATVVVQAFGTERQAGVGSSGNATVLVPVPDDHPLGPTEIRVSTRGEAAGLRPVSATRTLEVKEGAILDLAELPSDAEPGKPIEIVATLTDTQGEPLEGEPVAFRVAGLAAAALAETGADGTATVTLPAPEQDASVHARYPGSDVYASTEDASTPIGVHAVEATGGSSAWSSMLAGLALGGVLLAGVLVYRRRQRAAGEIKPMLEEAEKRIEAGEPWARVIQDTYRRLSVYLSARGFEERPTESPREFVQALAQTVEVPKSAAVALVHLYEEAAYADDETAPDQAEQARAELRSIIETIEAQIRSIEEPAGSDR